MAESRIPYEQASTLIALYKELYLQKYQSDPTFNVVSAKWSLADIVRELGFSRAKQLLYYFFRTSGNHDLERFVYNYHSMLEMMQKQEADVEYRKKLRSKPLP